MDEEGPATLGHTDCTNRAYAYRGGADPDEDHTGAPILLSLMLAESTTTLGGLNRQTPCLSAKPTHWV